VKVTQRAAIKRLSMTLSPKSRIVVAGAGSVGCYLGGCLAAAGRNVTLLLRQRLLDAIARSGLQVTDLEGSTRSVPPSALALATDASTALKVADLILMTVKCGATAEMSELIARHAAKNVVVVSLQNGIGNGRVLAEVLGPARRVVPGMVSFNVVQSLGEGAPKFHRASSGTICIGTGVLGLRDMLGVEGAPVAESPNIEGVLWGKLLINLNNALNALSDLPLAAELADRRWRILLSDQMREGLAALKACGIEPGRVEGMHPRLIAFALRLPDVLFRLAARSMLAVSPEARSSMWEDLKVGRRTEIDYIQGEILRIAARVGRSAPVTERVMHLIKAAERTGRGSPALRPAALAGDD
jgi:2-dehydropantoate 2-reductase